MKTLKSLSVLDWILPFRQEDNSAWERANWFGRILFPVYIIGAACRTISFWAMAIIFFPAFLMVAMVENRLALKIRRAGSNLFETVFLKKPAVKGER